eukprot:9474228-Lingulodinium_polyedra.AAC.1
MVWHWSTCLPTGSLRQFGLVNCGSIVVAPGRPGRVTPPRLTSWISATTGMSARTCCGALQSKDPGRLR